MEITMRKAMLLAAALLVSASVAQAQGRDRDRHDDDDSYRREYRDDRGRNRDDHHRRHHWGGHGDMREALERAYRATPSPKWVVAVGDCAADGGMFRDSYACVGGVARVIPVDLHIPGCPPTPPVQLLRGLLALLRLNEGKTQAAGGGVF